jgi:competence protein ComEC
MLWLAVTLVAAAFLPSPPLSDSPAGTWMLAGLAALGWFLGGSPRGRAGAALLCVLCLSHARALRCADSAGTAAWQAEPCVIDAEREQHWDPLLERRWSGERGWLRAGEWVEIRGEATPSRPARGPVERRESLPWLARQAYQPPREWLPDEGVRVAPAPGLAGWRAWLATAREAAWRRLASVEDPRARALCAALLFGETRELDAAAEQSFVRSGVYHLLVVSGTQVALLSALFFLPLARLLCSGLGIRPWAIWLAALCVLAYIPLAGGGAPVLRAALVWLAVTLMPARAGVRPRIDTLSVWAMALCVECLLDPLAPRSLSVQLSYGATLGLLAGTGPLLRVWRALRGDAGLREVDTLGQARAEWLLAVSVRVGVLLRSALASSLVATLATLPILCAHFGEFALLGMLATVLCAPWAALLLIEAAAIALFGLPLPESLTSVPSTVIHALARVFDALPGSPWCPPERPWLGWAFVCGAALLAVRKGSSGWLRASLLGLGVMLLPWTATPPAARTVALEVGHGTAVVHQALDGRVWLFDGGTRDRTQLASGALEALLARLDGTIACVALSHLDSDHANALPWIVERFPPALYAGPRHAALEAALPSTTPCVDLDRPGRLRLGAQAWLVRGERGEDNEGSRSLVLGNDGNALWLCGDAEESGLVGSLRVLRSLELRYACVLLPHHGAETPHLGALLAELTPEELWVSAGARLPLEPELKRRGLRWRWTERDGPLQWPQGSFGD